MWVQSKAIRGFCHLYDGQEACATGINAAMTKEDSWITSYRCHYIALIRGGTVEVGPRARFLSHPTNRRPHCARAALPSTCR